MAGASIQAALGAAQSAQSAAANNLQSRQKLTDTVRQSGERIADQIDSAKGKQLEAELEMGVIQAKMQAQNVAMAFAGVEATFKLVGASGAMDKLFGNPSMENAVNSGRQGVYDVLQGQTAKVGPNGDREVSQSDTKMNAQAKQILSSGNLEVQGRDASGKSVSVTIPPDVLEKHKPIMQARLEAGPPPMTPEAAKKRVDDPVVLQQDMFTNGTRVMVEGKPVQVSGDALCRGVTDRAMNSALTQRGMSTEKGTSMFEAKNVTAFGAQCQQLAGPRGTDGKFANPNIDDSNPIGRSVATNVSGRMRDVESSISSDRKKALLDAVMGPMEKIANIQAKMMELQAEMRKSQRQAAEALSRAGQLQGM